MQHYLHRNYLKQIACNSARLFMCAVSRLQFWTMNHFIPLQQKKYELCKSLFEIPANHSLSMVKLSHFQQRFYSLYTHAVDYNRIERVQSSYIFYGSFVCSILPVLLHFCGKGGQDQHSATTETHLLAFMCATGLTCIDAN